MSQWFFYLSLPWSAKIRRVMSSRRFLMVLEKIRLGFLGRLLQLNHSDIIIFIIIIISVIMESKIIYCLLISLTSHQTLETKQPVWDRSRVSTFISIFIKWWSFHNFRSRLGVLYFHASIYIGTWVWKKRKKKYCTRAILDPTQPRFYPWHVAGPKV